MISKTLIKNIPWLLFLDLWIVHRIINKCWNWLGFVSGVFFSIYQTDFSCRALSGGFSWSLRFTPGIINELIHVYIIPLIAYSAECSMLFAPLWHLFVCLWLVFLLHPFPTCTHLRAHICTLCPSNILKCHFISILAPPTLFCWHFGLAWWDPLAGSSLASPLIAFSLYFNFSLHHCGFFTLRWKQEQVVVLLRKYLPETSLKLLVFW